MPISVKENSWTKLQIFWTHTNLAGHNTFIRRIKRGGVMLVYLEKAGLSSQNTDSWHVYYLYIPIYNISTVFISM